jgi:predicted solute-binding protein
MSFAVATKIIVLLGWPFLFIIFLYLKDKEKFKKRLKQMFEND